MSDLSTVICNYINNEWISQWDDSIRSFASEHDVEEKTVRQIMDIKKTPYKIGLYTLAKMCKARGVSLAEFFTLIER